MTSSPRSSTVTWLRRQPDGVRAHVITIDGLWIDGEAIRQLELTASLPGMRVAVGQPDLHPGRGHPIGAAFLCDLVYPHLVGNDIGCGMALFPTGMMARSAKPQRWADRLTDLEGAWPGDHAALLESFGIDGADWPLNASLGTIGGGNHFAELQAVHEIVDPSAFERLGLSAGEVVLLVHSGSRGFGDAALGRFVDKNGAVGVDAESSEGASYLIEHDKAVAWGDANRTAIATRFALRLHFDLGAPLIDVCHNSVVAQDDGGRAGWLHRKGAAPAASWSFPVAVVRRRTSSSRPAIRGRVGGLLRTGRGESGDVRRRGTKSQPGLRQRRSCELRKAAW